MEDTNIVIEEKRNSTRSPATKKRLLNHKLELEDKIYDDRWKTCCIELDKRCVVYFVQMTTMISIMLFCIYQLITIKDCNGQQAYMGLLTLLIGIMCPSPVINKKKE